MGDHIPRNGKEPADYPALPVGAYFMEDDSFSGGTDVVNICERNDTPDRGFYRIASGVLYEDALRIVTAVNRG